MAEADVGQPEWQLSPEAAAEGLSRGKGNLYVFFYDAQVKHEHESRKAGRPIFHTRTKIKKIVPADPRLVIDTYASDSQIEQFPVEYARYKQKQANRPIGTPVEAWPALSDTQKVEFKALNIFTVEQVASLADSAAEKIMGLHELRKKARAFVMAQEAGEKLVEAEQKNQEKDRIIADLAKRLEALEAPKRKPGRPRKVNTAGSGVVHTPTAS